MRSSQIWAVTCLFNPCLYRRRIENYRAFRRRLQVPLLTVELSFSGDFELRAGDADILIPVSGGDVMWQKERLLNIGIGQLPGDCSVVATIDCDVMLADSNWPSLTVAALDRKAMVQLFTQVYDFQPGAPPDETGEATAAKAQSSAGRALACGASIEATLGVQPGNGRGACSPGLAWAFRRDVVARHGLYDSCIIGGGDTAMTGAAVGNYAAAEQRHCMTTQQRDWYRRWAEPWFNEIRGRIDAIDGDLYHFWHGDLKNRRAATRHAELASVGFDPARDIAAKPGQPWRWNSDKPRLHQLLADYFVSRREDAD